MINRYHNAFLIESKDPKKAFDAIKNINVLLVIENIWSDGKKHYFIVKADRQLNPKEKKLINEVING